MATIREPRIPSSCLALFLVLAAGSAAAAPRPPDNPPEATAVPIVPVPRKVTARPGSFTLGPTTKIQAPAALRGVAERFRDDLYPATGLPLPVVPRAAGSRVVLALDPRLDALGDEGYRLTISPREILVRARRPAGVFYGLQTVKQLLPAAVFRKARVADLAWKAPCMEIEDQPRFSWRGSHLDVGRHFQPRETLFKHLDVMALHKLNVFHWHLTEDQGWRIEIKKYPKLTEVGAWRKDTALGPPPERDSSGKRAWKFSGRPHGGFYTQDDVREVVRYAADRFITVVPEIEMPGHARAAIAAYPELGNTMKPVEVAPSWGVFEEVYNVEDRTLSFVKDVLTEVLDLFPSKFIHVGGDEVPKKEWKESPAAQKRMKALGLKNEEELQSWFIKQIDTWLTAKGRRLIGWDEILAGGEGWHRRRQGRARRGDGARRADLLRSLPGQDAVRAGGHRRFQFAGGGLRLRARPGGPERGRGQTRVGIAGPAVDRIHAQRPPRRIHGLAAAVRAGRGVVVAAGDPQLRGLQGPAGPPPHPPADPRRQLPPPGRAVPSPGQSLTGNENPKPQKPRRPSCPRAKINISSPSPSSGFCSSSSAS
jgi:hypothetical protein